MKSHSSYLISKKESALKNKIISPELADFYEKIFVLQESFFNNLKSGNVVSFKTDNKDLPVFKPEYLKFNAPLKQELEVLLKGITDVISEGNIGLDFTRLSSEFSGFIQEVFSELLKRDFEALGKRASLLKLDFDEFIFVIHNVFKPLIFFLRTNTGLQLESGQQWFEGTCPFCGYLPGMSKVVGAKDNQRILSCALCEHEWQFLRVTCFVCGNNEQQKQGFFESTENPLYRAYYCDECKSYIKTLNVTKAEAEGNYDLYVEDILTTFLDAAMLEKGYSRP